MMEEKAKKAKHMEKGDRYQCPCGCGCVIEVMQSMKTPETCDEELPQCCVADPCLPVCSCGCEMELMECCC